MIGARAPRPPRVKKPANYSKIQEAILARRAAEKASPPPPVKPKMGRPKKDRTPDPRPLPMSGSAPTPVKVRGVLERGMSIAEQIGAVDLKAQLLAAHANLRQQLIRSREMRRRMEAMIMPERMDEADGKAWIERQLARLVLDAAHQGDVFGAMGAAQTLALVAGHIEQPGMPGGTSVNVNLAAMVQRLDAEEHAREKLLEDQSTADPAAELVLRGARGR